MTAPISDDKMERRLRQLARISAGHTGSDLHVDEPLLALLRNGDLSDDIDDAILHVANCCDCRARLTEGEIERRQVVVLAIEAPKASQHDLAKAAQGANARLVERGDGRWTAVVDAEHSESLVKQLEPSAISRLALGKPVDVPLDVESGRASRFSLSQAQQFGTTAAEVQAWAQVARSPRRKVGGPSVLWTLLAVVVILAAVAIAYFLATR